MSFINKSKIVFTIIATLIGAGFASGQEICTFFFTYGLKGIAGLAICNLLFSAIICKVLKIACTYNIENYKEFIALFIGKNGFVINIIVNFFLLITFFIMIAGFGAYFSQELQINTYIGSGILACLCFFTFMTNANGVIKISSFLVPILIFFIALIGFINFSTLDITFIIHSIVNSSSSYINCFLSSLLYTSYNSILLIPVLITLRKHVINIKSIKIISIVSGLFLFILSLCIFFMLTKVNIEINKLEMPIVYVIRQYYKAYINIYAFIILSSIYTTAISIGMSFLNNINISKSSYPLIVLIMCIIGFIVSGFGFSNLVAMLYPIFGYLGLVQICLLLLF